MPQFDRDREVGTSHLSQLRQDSGVQLLTESHSLPEPAGKERKVARFLRTGLYCVAVAGLLWYLKVSDFQDALLVSVCVGFSITAAFTLFHERLENLLGPWLSPVILITVGVIVGLIFPGMLSFGDPLFLIVANPATLLLCLVLGIGGYLVVGTRGRLLQSRLRIAELERTQAQQAQQLAETRLKLLQAQIEPHFLFNTLGNVQGLIDTDPAKAQHLLEKLTALLRRSLAQTRSSLISLQDETELLGDYLEIQRVRMAGRLSYHIDLPQELAELPVPPLLLQPLVENAITHGIEPRKGPGSIDIRVERDGNTLVLKVADDGAGLAPAGGSTSGTGTALINIRSRLQERFGDAASLRLLENQPAGVVAEVRLPIDFSVESCP